MLGARLTSGIIMNWGMITAYLPFLINGFACIFFCTVVGDQLQVAWLNDNYVGKAAFIERFAQHRNLVRTSG